METKSTQSSQIQQPKAAPIAPSGSTHLSGLSDLRIQDIMLATAQAAAIETRNLSTLTLIEQKAQLEEFKSKLSEAINSLKSIEN